MTHNELQSILAERINIVRDKTLSAKDRQIENEITQTVVKVVQFMLAYLDAGQNNTAEKIKPFETQQESNKTSSSCSFNDEHEKWIIDNFNEHTPFTVLTRLFNEHFKTNISSYFIRQECINLGLIEKKHSQKYFVGKKHITTGDILLNNSYKSWLINNIDNQQTVSALTNIFNKHFDTDASRHIIDRACKALGLKEHNSNAYTQEEDNWLLANAGTVTYNKLAELFQTKFERPVTRETLKTHCYYLGICCRYTYTTDSSRNNNLSLPKNTGQNGAVKTTNLTETENKSSDSSICSGNPYKAWLIANFDEYKSIAKLTKAFNEHFKLKISYATITRECECLSLKPCLSFAYTKEENDWLTENMLKMPLDKLCETFRQKFKKHTTDGAIRTHCYHLRLPAADRHYASIFADSEDENRYLNQTANTVGPNSANIDNNAFDTIDSDIQCNTPVKTKSKCKLSWNDIHEQWLFDNFDNHITMTALTKAFNERFGTNVGRQLITEKCKLYGLREHLSVKYTPKEDSWLRTHFNNNASIESIKDLFEIRFKKNVSLSAFKSHCRNLGLLDRYYCKMPSQNNCNYVDMSKAIPTSTAEQIIDAAEKISNAADCISNAADCISDVTDRIIVQHGNNYNIFGK